MRIAYVHDVAYPWIKGGAELRNYEIARRLAKNHDVHIYCVKWWKGSSLIQREGITYHGICKPVILYGNRKRSLNEAVKFGLAVMKELPKEKFDIIEAYQSPYLHCFGSKMAAACRKTPLVYSWFEVWRNYWYDYLGPLGIGGKILERKLLMLPDYIITGSEKTVRDLADIGFKRDNIFLVHNGIDLKSIQKVRPSSGKFDVAYVGRLIKGKRVDLLVKATAILKKDFPKIRVAIMSDGPERKSLESLAKELSVDGNIRFFGFMESHDDIISVLRSSKVFVNPSVQEGGASIVLFEANACGLPAIAVSHPNGIDRALIEEGANGFFVGVDERQIAEKIRLLLGNRRLLERMKRKSRESVRKYDWSNIASAAGKAYGEMISMRGGRISAEDHSKRMREAYWYREKENYYNSYEYLGRVTRIDKFAPIVRKLAGTPGKVVDMGCGTGIWSRTLSEIGDFTGIDFMKEGISISRERNPGLRYKVGDMSRLEKNLRKNSVGMIFSSCAAYCLMPGQKKKMFSDVFSILKPGGKLIMIEPNARNIFREKSGIKYPFDKRETENLLRESGFISVRVRHYNFIPRSLIRSRGILYRFMVPVEKFLEFVQLPWSGSLMIYAEKPQN